MRKFGLLSFLVLGAVFGSLLSGCGEDETTQPVEEKANVKLYHVAPGIQNIDVKFNDEAFVLNRVFGDITTYLSTAAGSVNAKLYNASTTTQLAAKTLTLEKDKNYSLFVVADNAGAGDLVLFTDDLATPAEGKAHIRVAHMVPDGPAIKVAIMQKGPFAENVTFRDNTQPFVAVDAGAVTIRVQDNATAGGGGGGTTPLIEKSVLLEAGKSYTLIAQGKLSDSTAELVLVEN